MNQGSQPTYTDLEIRILAREARGYPIELTVDGSQFPRGYLDAGALPETSTCRALANGSSVSCLTTQTNVYSIR